MKNEPTFYMALPATEREKLREKQKLHTYREYTKNLTSMDINRQMNAESWGADMKNRKIFGKNSDFY